MPNQWEAFGLSLLFFDIVNLMLPDEEWIQSQLNQLQNSRCCTFNFVSNNRIQSGFNMPSNSLKLLNEKI